MPFAEYWSLLNTALHLLWNRIYGWRRKLAPGRNGSCRRLVAAQIKYTFLCLLICKLLLFNECVPVTVARLLASSLAIAVLAVNSLQVFIAVKLFKAVKPVIIYLMKFLLS
jgi:hypothetical protein